MKVHIGPYVNRWVCDIHDRHMKRRHGPDYSENVDWIDAYVEKVEDAFQWVYNHTINIHLDKKVRTTKVKIDEFDTWSMDHTLAPIITPLLKQLKAVYHGGPFVADEDVPEDLRSASAAAKENEWDIDEHYFKRWDYVLDEMIWAFEQKCRDDWEGDYYKFEEDSSARWSGKLVWEDKEGSKAHQKRMSNGFRLFGKYFESLWT